MWLWPLFRHLRSLSSKGLQSSFCNPWTFAALVLLCTCSFRQSPHTEWKLWIPGIRKKLQSVSCCPSFGDFWHWKPDIFSTLKRNSQAKDMLSISMYLLHLLSLLTDEVHHKPHNLQGWSSSGIKIHWLSKLHWSSNRCWKCLPNITHH